MERAARTLSVLLVDDDPLIHRSFRLLLGNAYKLICTANAEEGLRLAREGEFDLVFLDVYLANADGLQFLKKIKTKHPELDVIMVSGNGGSKKVVAAMQNGASDYLTKPIEKEDLLCSLERVLQCKQIKEERRQLQNRIRDVNSKMDEKKMIGSSRSIGILSETVEKLRGGRTNVLLNGESGVGKEILAQAIYAAEENPNRPFVAVNCAAIPQNLIESTLFGHEKGSFTGATEKRVGKFVLADGGDIFLDEISCLSPEMQAKLLRVLQEKEVEPVGAQKPIKVDFRVIAATNQDVSELIKEGKFREDLYYRLCVVDLHIPPLRARAEDIPLFVRHFMSQPSLQRYGKTISEEAVHLLMDYTWPGNVRQLKNTLENLSILTDGPVIDVADLPRAIVEGAALNRTAKKKKDWVQEDLDKRPPLTAKKLKQTIDNTEKDLILTALNRNRWSKVRTAKDLGMNRSTLYRRMVALGIEDREE